jgi:hypothetical protein
MMGLRLTPRHESQAFATPAQAGAHEANWIPAPRLRGDKLRANDAAFEGGHSGTRDSLMWNNYAKWRNSTRVISSHHT